MPECEFDLSGKPDTGGGIGVGGLAFIALAIIVSIIVCGLLYGLTDPSSVHALVP